VHYWLQLSPLPEVLKYSKQKVITWQRFAAPSLWRYEENVHKLTIVYTETPMKLYSFTRFSHVVLTLNGQSNKQIGDTRYHIACAFTPKRTAGLRNIVK
jgi:hypothetical protein